MINCSYDQLFDPFVSLRGRLSQINEIVHCTIYGSNRRNTKDYIFRVAIYNAPDGVWHTPCLPALLNVNDKRKERQVSDSALKSAAWPASEIQTLVNEGAGLVDPRIYTDQELYSLEMERIFGRSWLFLAHESQFKKAGDFVTTYMGDDPIIVVKQRDGSIKAFLNQCRHRGMRICRHDGGNARSFTCSYHGWAYDIAGKLVNVPYEKEAYGCIDKEGWSPRQVTRIETYKGLIFGNWDADAPSLADYLGEATYYMDVLLDRVPGGTELIGGINKWVIPCNWKFAAEQFCSDMYHVPSSHLSGMIAQAPADLPPEALQVSGEGAQFRALWGGHGCGFVLGDGGYALMAVSSGQAVADYWHKDSIAAAEAHLGELRARKMSGMHMTVFPNLSFLPCNNTMRVWHPRGPGEIEVWSFAIVAKEASPEAKEAQRLVCLRTFSPSGILEQDDAENWIEVQEVLRGHQAKKTHFNVQMGLGRDLKADDRFPGDMDALFSENAARGFYAQWLRMMTEDDWSSLAPEVLADAAE